MARNTGATNAKYDLFFLVDSDDLLLPGCLSALIRAMKENPQVDFVFCDFEFFGEEERIHRFEFEKPADLAWSQCLPAQVLMRRSFWSEVGGRTTDPLFQLGNEDWEFWMRAAQVGFSEVHLPDVLYRYRVHPAGITASRKRNEPLFRRKLLELHGEFISRNTSASRFLAEGHWIAAHAWNAFGDPWNALKNAVRGFLISRDWTRFCQFLKSITAVTLDQQQ